MLVSVDAAMTFTAASNTYTRIPYTTERLDTREEFDPQTSTFTAAETGHYQLCASLGPGANNADIGFEVDVFINGAIHSAFTTHKLAGTGCRTISLSAGDTVQVWTGQTSG
jgi:hypothetical protein